MQHLILIAGPSGAGKTTISQYLFDKYKIPRVITHTTRQKRSGEVDGVDYYFETPESFQKLHFFESVEYSGAFYGSSKEALEKAWQKNKIASLIVETKGVEEYLKQLPKESFFIYVTVSDTKQIQQRLISRGDAEAKIKQRLDSQEFKRDLKLDDVLDKHAHYLFNDDLTQAKNEIDQLIEPLIND